MYVMKTANVSTLRRELSRFLDEVRSGETIEILDRRVPIARLVPVEPATTSSAGGVPPWLERLRRDGVVRVGSLKPVRDILERGPPGPERSGALDALLEERRSGR
jgi:prevent-host-death family protein